MRAGPHESRVFLDSAPLPPGYTIISTYPFELKGRAGSPVYQTWYAEPDRLRPGGGETTPAEGILRRFASQNDTYRHCIDKLLGAFSRWLLQSLQRQHQHRGETHQHQEDLHSQRVRPGEFIQRAGQHRADNTAKSKRDQDIGV